MKYIIEMRVGVHISFSRKPVEFIQKLSYFHEELGFTALQIFCGSPYSFSHTEPNKEDWKEVRSLIRFNKIYLSIHAPYTINLCKKLMLDDGSILPALERLIADLKMGEIIGASGVVVHAGKQIEARETIGQGHQNDPDRKGGKSRTALPSDEKGKKIKEILDFESNEWVKDTAKNKKKIMEYLKEAEEGKRITRRNIRRMTKYFIYAIRAANNKKCKLLLENSCCEGSALCGRLDEIAKFCGYFKGYEKEKRMMGVCIDTCHLFAAGEYDISKKENVDRFFKDAKDKGVFPFIKCAHLNGSKYAFGSHRDRHAIPHGEDSKIEFKGINRMIQKLAGHNIPMILEPPEGDVVKEVNIIHESYRALARGIEICGEKI